MKTVVMVPGSCGELVEGRVAGIDFHITCPIALYTSVEIKSNRQIPGIKFSSNIANSAKTERAITKTLDYLQINKEELNLEIKLNSELSAAKGMASSTADITATIIALFVNLGEEIDLEVVKELALAVDPTDGVFIPGITAFDHLQGRIAISLEEISSIPILIFDTGEQIDTVKFSQRSDLKRLRKAHEDKIRMAYKLVEKGIKNDDWQLIGRGATISSLANQDILFKSYLEELIAVANNKEDILGINVAHSGSLIGVLLKNKAAPENVLKEIRNELPELKYLFKTKIINGGYNISNNY